MKITIELDDLVELHELKTYLNGVAPSSWYEEFPVSAHDLDGDASDVVPEEPAVTEEEIAQVLPHVDEGIPQKQKQKRARKPKAEPVPTPELAAPIAEEPLDLAPAPESAATEPVAPAPAIVVTREQAQDAAKAFLTAFDLPRLREVYSRFGKQRLIELTDAQLPELLELFAAEYASRDGAA